jgi:carbamoyltransferase
MAIILGLHFGHDGAAAVVIDGRVAGYVLRERFTRRKHDYGLDRRCLDIALRAAGVSLHDIDCCVVTSTQGCDAPLVEMGDFEITYSDADELPLPSSLLQEIQSEGGRVEDACAPSMLGRVLSTPRDPRTHPVFHELFRQYEGRPLEDLRAFPMLERHWTSEAWNRDATLDDLRRFSPERILSNPDVRYGFHVPVRVVVNGIRIPGVKLDHHLAHASSTYFRSGFQSALVFTNDGYAGDRSLLAPGGVFLGGDRCLVPLWPHRMTMGHVYHGVGMHLGFEALGAPGKLMGLAPYGRPRFFDPRRIETPAGQRRLGLDPSASGWIADVATRAELSGVDPTAPPLSWIPFNQFHLDLAASTQLVFERQWRALLVAGLEMARVNGLAIEGVCLSGGAALNCPSNTALLRVRGVRSLFVEPSCDDGGLAIGAALWLDHALPGGRSARRAPMRGADAYAGPPQHIDDPRTAAARSGRWRAEAVDQPEERAAADLAEGRIVGWFEGPSEQGPRALGHRSLFAAPFARSVLHRLNDVKGREQWRPFAPMVLSSARREYFDGPPTESPFMLHAVLVRSHTIPAAKHVDGTARVQTVTTENGGCYRLLRAFQKRTGCPVLLNTSLNGPGEPLLESFDDLLSFLEKRSPDVVYAGEWRIVREDHIATNVMGGAPSTSTAQ